MTGNGIAAKITYWAEQIGETALHQPEGIDEFRQDVSRNYVAVVHGRPGDLGGGLYHLAFELISNVTLAGIASYLASNVAWDAIKAGSTAFIIRPLLDAYRALRARNRGIDVDIESLTLIFQDTVLIVHRLGQDSIVNNLEQIMRTVGREYSRVVRQSGERPYAIRIPVFEDRSDGRISTFRELLDVDETIQASTSDYFRYWGLEYAYSGIERVYDVKVHETLDAEFLTADRYWDEWERRRGTQ